MAVSSKGHWDFSLEIQKTPGKIHPMTYQTSSERPPPNLVLLNLGRMSPAEHLDPFDLADMR